MDARIGQWWTGIRHSLWFLPTLMSILAAVLAFVSTRIDIAILGDGQATPLGVIGSFAFSGGADGARGVLSAIATGIITVIGVVFSVTIVALQLASSQFSPRVLRNFTGDRANQLVLGVFIGTFTYTLLVLRVVRSGTSGEAAFVPSVSVTVAIAMALISIGFLIFYIDHTADSIQASSLVDRSARDTLSRLGALFPARIGHDAESPQSAGDGLPQHEGRRVTTVEGGYLSAVSGNSLFQLNERGRYTVRMEVELGRFLPPGTTLASIWPAGAPDEVVDRVRSAFVMNPAEPPEDDVRFGITQLADIAVKALSPGINDPTTALRCVDRLVEIVVRLANQDAPSRYRTDDKERVLLIASRLEFADAVILAFGGVRNYGAATPPVAVHLLRMLGQAAKLVPADKMGAVEAEARRVLTDGRRSIHNPEDLSRVEQAAEWLRIDEMRGRLAV